jgi:hypothetical protein
MTLADVLGALNQETAQALSPDPTSTELLNVLATTGETVSVADTPAATVLSGTANNWDDPEARWNQGAWQ